MAKDYGAYVSTPDTPSACCGASGQIHQAIQKSKYVSGYGLLFWQVFDNLCGSPGDHFNE
ncbi:hypothetical protein HIU98_07545 [Enterococcus casseliflavus]|uniref:Uncharacterized protein n=3 Tax=Enterococcus TaxID=1350 RepID=A0A8F5V743_ENTCA|nr:MULTISPECIES: hypothetical protein [Bacillota]MBV6370896.1 hypothetical protein [Enterococcus casseliflavus]MBV6375259.1 hypothetical protein [Enterococcus casseliflavus]QXO84702.1 hypothetical protein Tn6712_000074 [Enterococcus faecium]QXO84844.1 hypothetical protein Tn6713_000074 [Enterococcus casseliflavus]